MKRYNWLADYDERLALGVIWNFNLLSPVKLRQKLADNQKPSTILASFGQVDKKTWLIQKLARYQAKLVILGDEDYPVFLENITSPPLVLFVSGELNPLFDVYSLGIVGSRKPTDYGLQMTKKLVNLIVDKGWTTISGLAFGIDGIVHQETLNAGGRTVAVIPSGLDYIYPQSHLKLAREIIKNSGAVITEIGFGPQPLNRGSFPRRNRIVAGFSRLLVIIEGNRKSGTLITASQAISMGREVYALPGRIDNPLAWAPNFLIQEGAKPIIDLDSFAEELDYNKSLDKKTKQSNSQNLRLSQEERQIIVCLDKKAKPLTLEEISQLTEIQPTDLIVILNQMELKGLVHLNPTGRYLK